jgi:flagellar biosynthesis/type III secretory pathway protein FliH
MENKQTAVDWFMEKIGEKQPNGLYVIDTLQDVQNVFEQAKEMEKQQKKQEYNKGYDEGYENGKEEHY